MSRKKELLKNTIIIFIGKISTQFLSFLLLPLYTSYLSASNYGYVDLIITYVSLFVPIITLEQEMATFRFLVDSRNDELKTKKIISSAVLSSSSIIFIFTIICLAILPFLDIKYKYLIVMNVIIISFSNIFLQAARGLGKNIEYSIACFIIGLITVISNIVLIVFLKYDAAGMIISTIIANIFGIAYLFIKLKLFKYITISSVDKETIKNMTKYSLPLIPNSICWWLINVSDRTLITIFLGTAANGIYSIACKFPSILNSFFSIFSLSWTESASIHINDKDNNVFFSDIINNAIKIFTYISVLLISFLPIIFSIIIKKEYVNSYNYIPILILGSFFSCIVGIYSAIYIAKKDTKKVAITSFLAATINVIVNYLFIKKIKLYAAALSTCIAYFAMMVYRGIDIKKTIKIDYNKKTITETIILFIITLTVYYKCNKILIAIYIFLLLIYIINFNYKTIKIMYENIKGKIKHEK